MKLKIPTVSDFRFTQYKGDNDAMLLRRMRPEEMYDKDNCFTVTFRGHTTTDGERRSAVANERFYRMEDGYFTAIDRFNPATQVRTEVMLTIQGTDLEYAVADGKFAQLEFIPQGSGMRVKEAEFGQWWSLLPDGWDVEVHKACLEVNPEWADTKSL